MTMLWPPDAKSWLIWKDLDAGKDWGQEEKGMTEDEMVGWHHWLDGHGFGWTPGVGDGQGGLVCCSSWGRKESDMTELNWTELHWWDSRHVFIYQVVHHVWWSLLLVLAATDVQHLHPVTNALEVAIQTYSKLLFCFHLLEGVIL